MSQVPHDVIDLNHELTKGFAAKLIRRKAHQLVGRAAFSRSDRVDLEQEMKMRIWQRFSQFDPQKSHWNAFVTTIVERHVASILQKARRKKRFDGDMFTSLNERVEDCDGDLVELGTTLGQEPKEALTGRYVDTQDHLTELELDVAKLIGPLPEDLKKLCELLKLHNIKDAAREMGIPRTTAYSLISKLRQIFFDAGFGDFFPNSSSRAAETR
jgi:RNA polymerase sigma-70 factor (ECF subfamily)